MECIVYLEEILKNPDGSYNAYLDFRANEDIAQFKESSRNNANFDEQKSFLKIESFKSAKRLIHDCYYKLNLNLLNGYQASIIDSYTVGRTYDLRMMLMPKDEASELLQSHSPLNPEEMQIGEVNDNIDLPQLAGKDLRITVRNIGQGNWNELLEGDTIRYVYDFGASKNAGKAAVDAIFKAREADLMRDKPILVLSHWDIDHYHCLKGLTNAQISACFSKCVCVDKITSVSATQVFREVKAALGPANVYCLVPPAYSNGLNMHLWRDMGVVSLFQGELSRNRNHCGIVLFIKGSEKSVNFTGDIRLIQAKAVYDTELDAGLQTDEHILIAPHHGGGCPAPERKYSKPTTEVIISVGPNSYGHPEASMLTYLNSVCANNLKRTDTDGDVTEVI